MAIWDNIVLFLGFSVSGETTLGLIIVFIFSYKTFSWGMFYKMFARKYNNSKSNEIAIKDLQERNQPQFYIDKQIYLRDQENLNHNSYGPLQRNRALEDKVYEIEVKMSSLSSQINQNVKTIEVHKKQQNAVNQSNSTEIGSILHSIPANLKDVIQHLSESLDKRIKALEKGNK